MNVLLRCDGTPSPTSASGRTFATPDPTAQNAFLCRRQQVKDQPPVKGHGGWSCPAGPPCSCDSGSKTGGPRVVSATTWGTVPALSMTAMGMSCDLGHSWATLCRAGRPRRRRAGLSPWPTYATRGWAPRGGDRRSRWLARTPPQRRPRDARPDTPQRAPRQALPLPHGKTERSAGYRLRAPVVDPSAMGRPLASIPALNMARWRNASSGRGLGSPLSRTGYR